MGRQAQCHLRSPPLPRYLAQFRSCYHPHRLQRPPYSRQSLPLRPLHAGALDGYRGDRRPRILDQALQGPRDLPRGSLAVRTNFPSRLPSRLAPSHHRRILLPRGLLVPLCPTVQVHSWAVQALLQAVQALCVRRRRTGAAGPLALQRHWRIVAHRPWDPVLVQGQTHQGQGLPRCRQVWQLGAKKVSSRRSL